MHTFSVENAHILCKLGENACIFTENARISIKIKIWTNLRFMRLINIGLSYIYTKDQSGKKILIFILVLQMKSSHKSNVPRVSTRIRENFNMIINLHTNYEIFGVNVMMHKRENVHGMLYILIVLQHKTVYQIRPIVSDFDFSRLKLVFL